jgi:hypothetical protein
MMPFRGTQNISVWRIEIKLEVIPNGIPKVNLAIALNRILIHPLGGVRTWTKNDF